MPFFNLEWTGFGSQPIHHDPLGRCTHKDAIRILKTSLESDEDDTLTQAIADLYEWLPERYGGAVTSGTNMLSRVIMIFAEQIPHADCAQDRLALLFKTASKFNRVITAEELEMRYEVPGAGCAVFINQMESNLDRMEMFERFHPEERNSFVNSRASIARLCDNGSYGGQSWLITTMRIAFEDKERPPDEAVPFLVLEAAMCIIYAGQWVYQTIVKGKEGSLDGFQKVRGVGELYGGPVLGYKRWKVWQDGFGKAIESGEIDGATRIYVSKAQSLMVAFDSILGTDEN
ncbi:DUF3632 domain-containing protein [Aspergillus ibericus CBS 121593]|uniref:Uncharacterized protein n=1 Tax=Aspergillus ibericus CBS 121593 TaxID=1448316 RepID=A0A395HE63_9EURO|nr:hypothetical protein BO80DRAFT_441393 [Aspergillus ibericus CBS 121593]RAL04514.1 hypothetical protein BO80DRAFT_441393 [Aspergillus ibericus CBS 121593]